MTYPSKRTAALSQFSVMSGLSAGKKELVLKVGVVADDGVFQAGVSVDILFGGLLIIRDCEVLIAASGRFLDSINIGILRGQGAWRCELSIIFTVMLDDIVVWNTGLGGISRRLSGEERGSLPDVGDLEGVILLDDLAEDIWDEEQARKNEQTEANAECDSNDEPRWLLVETKLWGTLVNDGQRADGSCNQEEEWRGVNSPLHGVGSLVDGLYIVSPVASRYIIMRALTNLMSKKMIDPKHPEMNGAMHKPAKMAPSPDPLFQPHSTLLAPTAATPTPAIDETREYVEET